MSDLWYWLVTKEQRPRLLAPTGGTSAGPPIPIARWGIGTAGITVQGPPVPSPASLIHTGIVPECVCSVVSCVQLFVTLWTVALQDPLSMGLFRQGCWSKLSFPPPRSLPNLGVQHVFFLYLLHCRQFFYLLRQQGSPEIFPGEYIRLLIYCKIHTNLKIKYENDSNTFVFLRILFHTLFTS